MLKFNGTFENLVSVHGCIQTFESDCTIYTKLIEGTHHVLRIVSKGYIHLDDCLDNSLNVINAIKNIDWTSIRIRNNFNMIPTQRVYIRYNRYNVDNGTCYSKRSLFNDDARCLEQYANDHNIGIDDIPSDLVDEICDSVRKEFNAQILVTKESALKIIEAYNQLQNS